MVDTQKMNIPKHDALPLLSQDILNKVLEKHAMYLRGQIGGRRAILQYMDMSDLKFHNHDLSQADFTGSKLVGADLSLGIYHSASFFTCDLSRADLSHADLKRSDFRGATLSGTNLTGADLTGADLRSGKVMERNRRGEFTDRKRGDIEGDQTLLVGARLKNANLTEVRAQSADFSNADLARASLRKANLKNARFEGANLGHADLSSADITHANMRDAILSDADFSYTEDLGVDKTNAVTTGSLGTRISAMGKPLEEILDEHMAWIKSAGKQGEQLNLSGYDLRDADDLRQFPLTAIKAIGATFIHLDLGNISIQSAILDKSDFRDCYMENADLRGSRFKNCKFTRTNLSGARLSPLQFRNADGTSRIQRVDLSGSDFRLTNLQHADLRDSIMMGVDLSGADLTRADLRRADLTGANLKNTDLTDALLDKAIIDFSAV